jgi:hypothetical protein
MSEKGRNFIIKMIIGLIVLIASWLLIKIVGKFLSDFWIQTTLAVIITWAVMSIGDKIGLPGFSVKKTTKKK